MSLVSTSSHEDHPRPVSGFPVSEVCISDNLTIYHADFYEEWKRVGIVKVDLILTDPPYGIFSRELPNLAWDIPLDIAKLELIFSQLLKPTAQVIMFSDISLLLKLLYHFSGRIEFKHYHIWEKSGGMPTGLTRPIVEVEFLLIFKRKGTPAKELTFNRNGMGLTGVPYRKRNYSPDVSTRRMKKSRINLNEDGIRFPRTIIRAPHKPNMKAEERADHPFQKPVSLLRKLIRTYSNPGDLVLDGFMGSGSTLVACHRENRKGIGFEIEKSYFDIAEERLRREVPQQRLFE